MSRFGEPEKHPPSEGIEAGLALKQRNFQTASRSTMMPALPLTLTGLKLLTLEHAGSSKKLQQILPVVICVGNRSQPRGMRQQAFHASR
ncbi:MAG: hypothetical protein GX433_15670 [Deltaproteobacteria bacterium]|nr:hypothetical protein [Deltaproteobacteria bacterium]